MVSDPDHKNIQGTAAGAGAGAGALLWSVRSPTLSSSVHIYARRIRDSGRRESEVRIVQQSNYGLFPKVLLLMMMIKTPVWCLLPFFFP